MYFIDNNIWVFAENCMELGHIYQTWYSQTIKKCKMPLSALNITRHVQDPYIQTIAGFNKR